MPQTPRLSPVDLLVVPSPVVAAADARWNEWRARGLALDRASERLVIISFSVLVAATAIVLALLAR
jgi:hypothetical protein